MTFRRDPHPEELISASLSGDLTASERTALDRHLADCERCRATLAAFAEERRLVSGMHRAAPPRELAAAVRAGVEAGGGSRWWRRPSTLVAGLASLATVAAAVLAVVVLSNLPRGPIGATGSPAPSASVVVSSAAPSSPPSVAQPSVAETPLATPAQTAGPDPVGNLEYLVRDQRATMSITAGGERAEVAVERFGLPINAALAPGGDWVAFQVLGDGSGLVDTYAYRIADGLLVQLAAGGLESPFARLAWTGDGSLLAFTAITSDGSADAWIFSALSPDDGPRQLTDTGRAFAADFYGGTGGDAWLWVSTAEGTPTTDRLAVPIGGSIGPPVDPSSASLKRADGVFLPLHTNLAGSQGGVVAWRGEMARDESGWHFARGGMPYLYAASIEGEYDFFETRSAPVFDTLTIGTSGQAFRSARFAWAPDGDGFAVWDAQWEGVPQPEGFPDPERVYFGHLLSGVFIGPEQALDPAATTGGRVINVALGGGPYLAITVQTAEGSEGGMYGPTAELRLVTRNLGATPDEVRTLTDQRVWIGPAFYHASVKPD